MLNKNIIITGTFITIIFGVSIFNILTPSKQYSTSEKRKLAQLPSINTTSFIEGTFSKQFEEYFNDQFILRDIWINLKTSVEVLSNKKDINGVYLAKDNYLIENTSTFDIENFNKNLNHISTMVNNYSSYFNKENMNVMLIPTASEILSDKLPMYADTISQLPLLSKASDLLGDNFINTYPILKENNSKYIYYKTDHHWTTLGAYYAYTEWANKKDIQPIDINTLNLKNVSTNFKGTLYSKLNYSKEADRIDIYNPEAKYNIRYNLGTDSYSSLYELSHTNTSDQYSLFLNGNHGLVQIDSSNKNGKKLVVFKDSYANCFIPFIADEYESIYVIDLRYFNAKVSNFIKENNITELLLLYNINSLSTDTNLYKLNN